MLWIVKALFVLAKTRRGRKLLFAGALAASELAQGERARKLYAKALSRPKRASGALGVSHTLERPLGREPVRDRPPQLHVELGPARLHP